LQKTILIVLTLVLAVAVSGCAGLGGSKAEKISATDNQFTPNSKSVKQNTEMTWTNNGDAAHTVTIHKVNDPVTTTKKDTEIAKGTSTTYKFEETGTYHVYCKYHSGGTAGSFGNGMVMTVTVTA
jgi:plastocyanin